MSCVALLSIRGLLSQLYHTRKRIKQFTTGLIIPVFLNLPGFAQTWQPLGLDDTDWPTLNVAKYSSMAVSGNGTPYVVYRDYAMDKKATARKYNGVRWVDAGMPGFSEGLVMYTSIAVNKSGIPYVVYGVGPTVKKLIGDNWVYVGPPAIADENYSGIEVSIAIDDNGTPYVVYVEGGLRGKISVKKFTAGSWVNVGPPRFSVGLSEGPSIVIGKNGTPYVAYHDASLGYKAVVKKFSAGQWVDIGDPDTPPISFHFTKLAINNHGTPYLAYYDYTVGEVKVKKFRMGNWIDVGTPGFPALGSGFVYVAIDNNGIPYLSYSSGIKKFIGDSWVDVGTPGSASGPIAIDNSGDLYASGGTRKFTCGNWITLGTPYGISQGPAYYISVAVDGNSTPYTVYQDGGNYGKTTVKKFDGTNWNNVGTPGFSEDSVWYISIAIRNNGTPLVIYQDKATGYKATVKRFSAGRWRNVGSPGFSAGVASYTSIDVDNQGTPYVIYRDDGNGGRATVRKFKNGSWRDVGLPGFSDGTASGTFIALGDRDIPYVVYSDGANDGKATVKKFSGGSWRDVGSPGFSTGTIIGASIAINRWGTPYVAYRDGNYIVIKYFIQGGWTDVGLPVAGGNTGFDSSPDISLAIDGNDDPYIAYKVQTSFMNEDPPTSTMKYSVRKFNGIDWIELWPPRLGGEMIPYPTIDIAITPSGIPIVVYNHRDQAFAKSLSDCNKSPESIMAGIGYEKPDMTDNIKVENRFSIEVHPNPIQSTSVIKLEMEKGGPVTLRLTDMQGRLIRSKQYSLPTGISTLAMVTDNLRAGVYILEAIIKNEKRKVLKIVVL